MNLYPKDKDCKLSGFGDEVKSSSNSKWSKDGGRQEMGWLNLLYLLNLSEVRLEGRHEMILLKANPKVRWVKVRGEGQEVDWIF